MKCWPLLTCHRKQKAAEFVKSYVVLECKGCGSVLRSSVTEQQTAHRLFCTLVTLLKFNRQQPKADMDTAPLIAKRFLLSTLLGVSILTAAGCGAWWLPRPHKIEIQQGNLLPPAAVEKIVEGMSKNEVVSILGEPVVSNHFDRQRWDYIYSLNRSGDTPNTKRLTLIFANDRVVSIEKDGLS